MPEPTPGPGPGVVPRPDDQLPGGSHAVAAFLAAQIDALDELDLVVVVPVAAPLHAVAIHRLEGGSYAVRIPTRPPGHALSIAHREHLDRLGYRVRDPQESLGERRFDRAEEAGAAAATLLREVFGHGSEAPLDIRHGSRRPERDAARKLEALRRQVEPVITEFLGTPPRRDPDGDYIVPHEAVTVIVAPRAMPGAVPVVRVATVTNLQITPSPDVGILLANLNFGLSVGRFALDTEQRAIWFDDTLLGETVVPEVLRLAIEVVAHTAADWARRFQQLFGGVSSLRPAGPDRSDTSRKPGEGGYL